REGGCPVSADKGQPLARRHLLQGAAAVGALAALEAAAWPQATDTEAAAPSLIGSWIVHIADSTGTKSVDLASFTKDGLVFDAGSLPLKAPPPGRGGPPSVGLGTWAEAAGGGFDVTFVSLAAGPKGAFAGTVTIS